MKALRQKGSSTLMPRGLVLGMNDHQGSCWVLIVVTRTHRQLAAKCGTSAPRSHRHKAVLSPVTLTLSVSGGERMRAAGRSGGMLCGIACQGCSTPNSKG